MYKKILVPLDGSPYSECVLDHVKELALGCNSKSIVIMYVVEPINPGMYEVPAQVVEDAVRNSQQFGSDYLAGVAAKLKAQGLEVEPVLMNGRAAESILDYAKANGVDLIAMSTHGRSGISRWLLGSVAEKIIRHSLVPVLLVTPAEIKAEEARK